MTDPRDIQLACGTPIVNLVEQVFEGAQASDPGHQADCPHCQAALRKLESVYDRMTGLAAEPVAAPPDLVQNVMRRLRRDRTRVLVSADPHGSVTVEQAVIVQIARLAALEIEGVAFASVQLTRGAPPGSVALSAQIVVDYGPPISSLAATVRDRIQQHVARYGGILVTAVDLAVEDIE